MFFPLQISGKRKVCIKSNTKGYTRHYLDALRKKLEDAGARNIIQSGNEISFKGPWISSKVYDLKKITYGYISISSKDNEIVISYKVRYTYLFIFCTLAVFGFAFPLMLVTTSGNIVLPIIFLIIAWLWIYGGNVALSYSRFRKRIIKSQ